MWQAKLALLLFNHRKKIIPLVLSILLIPAVIISALDPFSQDDRFNPYNLAYNEVVEEYNIREKTILPSAIQAIELVIYQDISERKQYDIKQNITRYFIKINPNANENKPDNDYVFRDKDEIINSLKIGFNLDDSFLDDIEIMLEFKEEAIANNTFIDPNIEITTGDFQKPFNHYTITAGTWNYPASFGGRWHPGVDFAVPVNSEVKAAMNLTKLHTNSKSGGYGTYGVYAGQKEKDSYAFIYAHNTQMENKNTYKQGERLAWSGNTGNSTGPHTHVEIFLFKNQNVSDVINLFKTKGEWFGLGYNGKGDCNKVCRLQPEMVFGVKLGDVK